MAGIKVIYHCYGGTHSSVLAAAMHLGLLEKDQVLSAQKLFSCPLFDQLEHSQIGTINRMGTDSLGHEIYVMGCKNAGTLVEKILPEFCKVLGIDQGAILLISTISCLNIFLRLGGYLARRAGQPTLGRHLLLLGARRAMRPIGETVARVKYLLQGNGVTGNFREHGET